MMKKNSIISVFALVLSACMLTVSCQDMLTPDMDRYADSKKFGEDSVYSALGVLRSIQRVAERTIILDASRSDLVTSGSYTTDSINNLANFNNPADGSSALCNVADYYHIVNSCNFYLANVDTVTTVNSKKPMLKEWAQVQAMRAWAYIQLVRNYGEVPFVITPVGSTSEAESISKSAVKVNASNLASLLVENGLAYAYVVQRKEGMPSYGTFDNGNATYNAQKNLFPVELMLADAYLMANDYTNAANYYYEYFSYDCSSTPMFGNGNFNCGYTIEHEGSANETSSVNSGNYNNIFQDNLDDNIVCATSASTPSIGQTLTQVQNVFGFKTTISGTSINATPSEQYIQLVPSTQYISTNTAQNFNVAKISGDVVEMRSIEPGDGRYFAVAPKITLNGGSVQRLVTKFVNTGLSNQNDNGIRQINNSDISYHIQLYRVPMAVLRYAEAVNRLGFPEFAFGILRDGLISENLPSYGHMSPIVPTTKFVSRVYDEDNNLISCDTIPGVTMAKISVKDNTPYTDDTPDSTKVLYEDAKGRKLYLGDFVPYEPHDSIPGIALSEIPQEVQDELLADQDYILTPTAYSGGMYYLSLEEAKAMSQYPFMDFSNSRWQKTSATDERVQAGVHARGAGQCDGIYDTVFTYAKQVAEKMAQEYARQNNLTYAEQQAYAKTLYSGDKLLVTDKEAIINAVENIIVDELALETAFEGNRYGDLIRIAEHKNQAGLNGTDWFAWKIARRDYNYNDNAGIFNATLKAKLLDKSNWYLSLPE